MWVYCWNLFCILNYPVILFITFVSTTPSGLLYLYYKSWRLKKILIVRNNNLFFFLKRKICNNFHGLPDRSPSFRPELPAFMILAPSCSTLHASPGATADTCTSPFPCGMPWFEWYLVWQLLLLLEEIFLLWKHVYEVTCLFTSLTVIGKQPTSASIS